MMILQLSAKDGQVAIQSIIVKISKSLTNADSVAAIMVAIYLLRPSFTVNF